MNQQIEAATIKSHSHWVTSEKEEIYFHVSITLPRVGLIETRFTADRYMASVWHGGENSNREWTQWRVNRDTSQSLPGVGPKTLDVLYEQVVPVVLAWLDGAEYAPSWSSAIVRFIVRTASDNRGYGILTAKELLTKYSIDLPMNEVNRINKALSLIEEGHALLNGGNE